MSYWPGVTGDSGELALLLALLELREPALRLPAFFLKTLKKQRALEKVSDRVVDQHPRFGHTREHKHTHTYLTVFSRYDIVVTLLESDSSSEL